MSRENGHVPVEPLQVRGLFLLHVEGLKNSRLQREWAGLVSHHVGWRMRRVKTCWTTLVAAFMRGESDMTKTCVSGDERANCREKEKDGEKFGTTAGAVAHLLGT